MRNSGKEAPQFDLVTDWAFEVALEQVCALLRVVEWPSWWQSLRRPSARSRPSIGTGLSIYPLIWRTVLPYLEPGRLGLQQRLAMAPWWLAGGAVAAAPGCVLAGGLAAAWDLRPARAKGPGLAAWCGGRGLWSRPASAS